MLEDANQFLGNFNQNLPTRKVNNIGSVESMSTLWEKGE